MRACREVISIHINTAAHRRFALWVTNIQYAEGPWRTKQCQKEKGSFSPSAGTSIFSCPGTSQCQDLQPSNSGTSYLSDDLAFSPCRDCQISRSLHYWLCWLSASADPGKSHSPELYERFLSYLCLFPVGSLQNPNTITGTVTERQ